MAIIDCDFWIVRRKLLGVVGGQHRGAVTLRRVAHPCNSNLRRQQITRRHYAAALFMWTNVLTQWERDNWQYLSENAGWHDYLEQEKMIWGMQWFVAMATRQMRAGLTVSTDENIRWWGVDLSSLSVALLSSTSVRVTFTAPWWRPEHLVVLCRGPLAPGVQAKAPTWAYHPESTPRGWSWLGVTGLSPASPQDFTLPRAIPAGAKVAILAGGMEDTGLYCQQWRAAEVIGV